MRRRDVDAQAAIDVADLMTETALNNVPDNIQVAAIGMIMGRCIARMQLSQRKPTFDRWVEMMRIGSGLDVMAEKCMYEIEIETNDDRVRIAIKETGESTRHVIFNMTPSTANAFAMDLIRSVAKMRTTRHEQARPKSAT